ncbi:unnamed protein product [Clonostachys rosea]|uniref:Cytochrome P450 n=1 Tax=Bionectria ochroleuca TaxID=29856 RepID=A0ABY6UJ81_BIOOC|nr:unnamed protein product [Clonostachys rosea]
MTISRFLKAFLPQFYSRPLGPDKPPKAEVPNLSTTVVYLALVLVTSYYVVPLLQGLYVSRLWRIPGPFLARFTRLWEFVAVLRGNSHLEYIRLHNKYGPIVRLGPNRYSVKSPADVKSIYELGSRFVKSDYYRPLLSEEPDLQHIFPLQNNEAHKDRRRKISSLYTMSSMVAYEDAVDRMTQVCVQKIYEFTKNKALVDIPQWMQYYAFDVIGEITFNTNFGMMEKETDTSGLLPEARATNDFLGLFGIIPDTFSAIMKLGRLTQMFSKPLRMVEYITDQVERNSTTGARSGSGSQKYETFLEKVLRMQAEGRIRMTNVMDACLSNIGAGSDTTAITLSAALYYLYRSPDKLKRLRDEIDKKDAEGQISDPITFSEAQRLNYLQAVIKETLRMHPAVGSMLPRVVPSGGIQLSGHYFPKGTYKTEVGVNAWVLHYDDSIYGPDPKSFRPERWIDQGKTSLMDSMMFAFGGGSRTCIGKNISLLEITKLIPQLVRKFDLIFEHSDKPMDTVCTWFVYPSFKGYFRRRA